MYGRFGSMLRNLGINIVFNYPIYRQFDHNNNTYHFFFLFYWRKTIRSTIWKSRQYFMSKVFQLASEDYYIILIYT